MTTKREIIEKMILPYYEHVIGTVYYEGFKNRLFRMDEQDFIRMTEKDLGFMVQPIIKNHYILSL